MDQIRDNSKLIKFLIVLIALIFIFFLVYRFRSDFDYPIHVDEWHHITQATYIINTEHIPSCKEYLELGYRPIAYIEVGFFLFLSQIILLTGIDPVLQYRILPPIFTCVAAFMAFLLSYKFTKKFYVGVFTMLIFGSIKSNFNILGNLFFTPLSFGFALIYLMFFTITEGIKRRSLELILISMMLSATLIIIHPPSVIMVYFIIFVYLILRANIIKENFTSKIVLIAFLVIFLTYLLYDLESLDYDVLTPRVIKNHIFGRLVQLKGSYPAEAYYDLWDFYGNAQSILAIIGIFFVLKRDRRLVFALWSIITVSIIFMFGIYGVSIISTYQKMIFYASMSLAVLSGIGLNFILELFMKIPYKSIGSILALIFLATVFFYIFKDYYPGIPDGYLVREKDYEVAKWLKDNNYSSRTVLGTFFTSEALYSVSGNYPIANIFFKGNGTARSDMGSFFGSNCTIKKEIIDRYNISLIVSESEIECDNFSYEQIYNKNMFFIYEVKNN